MGGQQQLEGRPLSLQGWLRSRTSSGAPARREASLRVSNTFSSQRSFLEGTRLDGKTVHHRIGIRDNNRPEELEVWTRPQSERSRISTTSVSDRTGTGTVGGRPKPSGACSGREDHQGYCAQSSARCRRAADGARPPSQRGVCARRRWSASSATTPIVSLLTSILATGCFFRL